jgi:hypothetical protein
MLINEMICAFIEVNAIKSNSTGEGAFRIVPATVRGQHQVSFKQADNTLKFMLNHLKMLTTSFPGMNLPAVSGRGIKDIKI